MAGSDQSVNLTGMLGQISNTLGAGYQINGKNAGAALGDNIALGFKPEVNTNDPNSYMALAEWADRNGRPDEAKAYRAEATAVSEKLTKQAAVKQEAEFTSEIQSIQARMTKAQAEGNVIAYQQAQEELSQVQGNGSIQQANFAKSARNDAAGGLEKTQDARTQKTATSIIQYQERLANPDSEFQGSGKVVMEQWVEKQLQDPKMREAYNDQLEQQAKTETMKIKAKAQADEAAANGLMAVYQEGGIAALNDATEKLGTPQAMAVQKQIVEFHKMDEEYASADDKIAADLSTLDVLGTTIAELGNSMTAEAVAIFEHEHKILTDKAKSGKLTHAGELHSAVKALRNQVNNANIARISHVTGQKEREAQAEAAANKRVDMLRVGQDQRDHVLLQWKEQINALPVNSSGWNPFDNVDPDALPQRVLDEMFRDSVRANAGTATKHWQIDPETRQFVLDKQGMPVAVDGSSVSATPKTKDTDTDTVELGAKNAKGQTRVTQKRYDQLKAINSPNLANVYVGS